MDDRIGFRAYSVLSVALTKETSVPTSVAVQDEKGNSTGQIDISSVEPGSFQEKGLDLTVDVKDINDEKYTDDMTDKEDPGNMDGPEPADGGGSGKNTEGTDHTDEAESADDGEPGENAENMDSTEYTDETGSADNGEVTDDTADTDGEKQAEDTESAGDPEYTDH